jgi:hypothetical protein
MRTQTSVLTTKKRSCETMAFFSFLLLSCLIQATNAGASTLPRKLQSTAWIQLGADVTFTGSSKLGRRVGVSGDGYTILTSGGNPGGVVYTFVSGNWVQNGTAITGK